ncbi:MAG: ATP-grasp domain-containing protein [Candidatus Nanohaloarchaea archaeon]|nr:ATP-grasp domain-containing protein [Candidatus Nanohaloarchaea archaeon]
MSREQPAVGVLWNKDINLAGDAPFEREVKNADYRTFTELASQRGLTIYVARLEWYSGSRLRRAWRWEDGWETVDDVPLDLVVDKFAFTDATATVKQAIEDDIGTMNRYRLKELCRDKWETYQLFEDYMPETRQATRENIAAMLEKYDRVVCKPRYGAGGEGIQVIDDTEEFEPEDDLLVQRYIELDGIQALDVDGPHDLRVAVVDGEVAVSYVRTNDEGQLANISQGGGELVYVDREELPEAVHAIVERTVREFERFQPCLYTVDFVFGPDEQPYLIELNTKPPFGYHREIQEAERERPLIDGILDIIEERTG